MRRYERELIERALQKARGGITQAARILGITHQALKRLPEHQHKGRRVRRGHTFIVAAGCQQRGSKVSGVARHIRAGLLIPICKTIAFSFTPG